MRFPQQYSCRLNTYQATTMFWQEEVTMRLARLLASEERGDLDLLSTILDDFAKPGSINIDTIRDFVIDLKRFPDGRIME